MRKTFTQKVYDVVRRIPRGKVMTYGAVARRAGSSGAGRAVGNAMHKNQRWPAVPCHRVVKTSGELGRWSGTGGTAEKRKLLAREGVAIRNGKVDPRNILR